MLELSKDEMVELLTRLKNEAQKEIPMLELEQHWTNIVHDGHLKQMNEFHEYFLKLQEVGYMRDVDSRRVFLNYPELYSQNSRFWKKSILQMLENSRDYGIPLDPTIMKNGFERIDEWLPCYKTFICGYADCHNYVQKCQKDHALFFEFVKWAESQDTMRRQSLLDALANPMQRLTRYRLLLEAIRKNTVGDAKQDTIQEMITRIEKAARDVDETLNKNDLRDKLIEVLKAIESYEAIDCKEFERIFSTKFYIPLADPMPYCVGEPQFRRVYLRDDLKMKDGKYGKKIDVHCILFTDLFLICKISNKRYGRLRILKSPIHITKLRIQRFPNHSNFVVTPINDFGMPSALYYFSATSTENTRKWFDMIDTALKDFYDLKHNVFLSIFSIFFF
uniref:DH domain-containing protein n=1 Tax=Onchocerca volvulus TaxID=6282 RepID=A0A8R1TKC3_ONCVO